MSLPFRNIVCTSVACVGPSGRYIHCSKAIHWPSYVRILLMVRCVWRCSQNALMLLPWSQCSGPSRLSHHFWLVCQLLPFQGLTGSAGSLSRVLGVTTPIFLLNNGTVLTCYIGALLVVTRCLSQPPVGSCCWMNSIMVCCLGILVRARCQVRWLLACGGLGC